MLTDELALVILRANLGYLLVQNRMGNTLVPTSSPVTSSDSLMCGPGLTCGPPLSATAGV